MAVKADLSRKEELQSIANHRLDLINSLILYFSPASPLYIVRFASLSHFEVREILKQRLEEVEYTSLLTLLASLEANFRLDYDLRVQKRWKDSLSRQMKKIYDNKQNKASLERDIFEAWKNCVPSLKQSISYINGAFKLRHWLAHGRYWAPKLGQNYDFQDLYVLIDRLLTDHLFQRL